MRCLLWEKVSGGWRRRRNAVHHITSGCNLQQLACRSAACVELGVGCVVQSVQEWVVVHGHCVRSYVLDRVPCMCGLRIRMVTRASVLGSVRARG